jgi:lipopolysaccharide biosynthesis regulator YciM
MASFWRQFFVLCWLCYVLFACVAVFLGGFLLNRDVFTDRAACRNKTSANYVDELNGQICTQSKKKVSDLQEIVQYYTQAISLN